MSILTQVRQVRGDVTRVPRGTVPVIELQLEPGQYIAGFKLSNRDLYSSDERKTVDWRWSAFVVTPLNVPDGSSQ